MQILAIIFMALGGYVSVMNWCGVFVTIITKKFHSAVPFFGAALLGTGMLLNPATRSYSWLAIPLDYGTLIFLLCLPKMIREMWKTSRFNLLEEYHGTTTSRTITLSLYRRGIYILKFNARRPTGEVGITSLSTVGNWLREDQQLKLLFGLESAILIPSPDSIDKSLRVLRGFDSWESDPVKSLSNIELIGYKSKSS